MTPEQIQEWRRARLQAALERKFENNKAALGRALGYTDGAFIRQMLAGSRQITEKTVQQIEGLPGLSSWFEPPYHAKAHLQNVRPLTAGEPLPDEVIPVAVYDVKFSAGNGRIPSYELVESAAPAYYQREWFQRQRINPLNARRFEVVGNSMEPLLAAGDHVLVDLGDTHVVDGRVYAIRYGDELRIKKVWRHLDGSLTLRSENRDYVDESVPAAVASEHISIIGRVRDRSGSGGL